MNGSTIERLYNLTTTFARLMGEGEGVATLEAIDAENEAKGWRFVPDSCASHDHTDPNEYMETAFRQVMGRPSDPSSETDARLMNDAWHCAKYWTFVYYYTGAMKS